MLSKFFDVLRVVVSQPQELLYMLNTRRRWPSANSRHFVIVHPNLPIFNNVAQVLNATLCKRAFLSLCVQLVLAQSLKDCAQVLNVFTRGLTVHQNVVQVNSDGLVQHIREHVMHQTLKRGRSVRQT